MGERYVKFSGDAINAPLYKSFHRSAGLQLTGLVFAFNAAAIMTTNAMSPLQGLGYLGGTLASYAVGESLARVIGHSSSARHFSRNTNKCIDTNPGPNAIPTNPTDLRNAKSTLKTYASHLAILGGMGLASSFINRGASYPVEIVQNAVEAFTSPTSNMGMVVPLVWARSIQTGYRFYKVVKGDYVIVDTPKPEEKKATENKFTPVFSPS